MLSSFDKSKSQRKKEYLNSKKYCVVLCSITLLFSGHIKIVGCFAEIIRHYKNLPKSFIFSAKNWWMSLLFFFMRVFSHQLLYVFLFWFFFTRQWVTEYFIKSPRFYKVLELRIFPQISFSVGLSYRFSEIVFRSKISSFFRSC